MPRMHLLSACLIIASCAMGACTLQEIEERGNSCPADTNSLSIPYILVQTSDGNSSRVIPQLGGEYNDVLVYKKCPKEYPNCAVDHDGNNYCSSCPNGQVLCNNKCINPETDINHCGASGGCNVSEAGSPDFQGHICVNNHICEDGYCELKCPTNKHSLKDGCEDDDINNCGKHGRVCAQYIDGWVNGECKNGECIVSECDEKIGRLNKEEMPPRCERFTNKKCGLDSVDCGNLFCSNGECKASCMENLKFCNNTTCVDLNNSADHCGDCGYVCMEHLRHALNATCSRGQCFPLECEIGWHVNAEVCEEDSVDNCGDVGNTCTIENGTSKCEEGNCVIDHCDEGYIQSGKRCIQSTPNPPQNPECTSDNDCTIDNGAGTCNAADGKCKYTCNQGYKLEDSTCIIITNPPETKPECTTNDDCTIEHGTGTCNLSNGKCDYICDKLYIYNDVARKCELQPLESECIKDSDCTQVKDATGACSKGQCTYTCSDNYHVNSTNDECVEDSPAECGSKREHCGESCIKSLKDSSKTIGLCTSGFCTCKECTGINVANSDHTKCEKPAPITSCDEALCLLNHEEWKAAVCQEDVCVVTECVENYHLYKETKDTTSEFYNITICEEDTVEHCGSHLTNCKKTNGWKNGVCKDSLCKASACLPGYKLVSGKCQEIPSVGHCSLGHYDCNGDGSKCCENKEDCNNTGMSTGLCIEKV